MSKSSRWHDRLLSFKENWERIVAIAGIALIAAVQILGEVWPFIKEKAFVLGAGVYLVGFAVVFLLLDLQKSIKVRVALQTEQNFSAAMPRIIELIVAGLRRGNAKRPLRVRLVGMRLTAITRLMAELAHTLKEVSPLRRSLEITLYHVEPRYLRALSDEFGGGEAERWKAQSELLQGQIAEIGHMFSQHDGVTITLRSYRSIPFFWAVDVDTRVVFWGHFLWDDIERNWIGPENPCYVFEQGHPHLSTLTKGLLNRIDSLERWSSATTILNGRN
jgi:hypothetical protein